MLSILQFIHDFYAAMMLWAYETGPVVILIFWPTLFAIYYVLVKLGEWIDELLYAVFPSKTPKSTDYWNRNV